MNWSRSASVTVRLAVAKAEPSVISSQVLPRTRGSTSEDGTNGWVAVMARPFARMGVGGKRWSRSALLVLGQSEHRLGQDVALDLRGAGVDRPGPCVQV